MINEWSRKRAVALIAVVALVSLSGCSILGLGGDGGSATPTPDGDATPTDNPDATETPDGTPTPTDTGTVEENFPPGAHESGLDAEPLAMSHETVIRNSGSYTLEVQTVYDSGPDGNADRDVTETVNHARVDGAETWSSTTEMEAEGMVSRGFSDGDATYMGYLDNGDWMYQKSGGVIPPQNDQFSGPTGVVEGAASGQATYEGVTTIHGDVTVYEYTINEAGYQGDVINGTLYVAEDGYIAKADLTIDSYQDGEVVGQGQYTMEITALGETSVDRPGWVDDAESQTD